MEIEKMTGKELVQTKAEFERAAPPDPMTRQHRRHATRAGLKAILHETKKGALRDKRKGGAAAITSVMQS